LVHSRLPFSKLSHAKKKTTAAKGAAAADSLHPHPHAPHHRLPSPPQGTPQATYQRNPPPPPSTTNANKLQETK